MISREWVEHNAGAKNLLFCDRSKDTLSRRSEGGILAN